ncbi:hypothetical protein [Rhizobium leguminosarum]|nr:hypothetical protein [Rhizobium leguminosarum]
MHASLFLPEDREENTLAVPTTKSSSKSPMAEKDCRQNFHPLKTTARAWG